MLPGAGAEEAVEERPLPPPVHPLQPAPRILDRHLAPAVHPRLLGGRPTYRLGIPLAPLLPPVLGNERSVHLGNPIGLLPGIRNLDRTSEEAEAILRVERSGGGGHVFKYHPCLSPQSIPTEGDDLQDLVMFHNARPMCVRRAVTPCGVAVE